MSSVNRRTMRGAFLAMSACLVLAACGSSAATPTAAPAAAPTVAPTAPPTDAPTATPTVAPTVAPTPTPTAAPTEGPTATPTVAAAAGRTAVIPANLANKCSATVKFRNLFGEAAQREPFGVYCPVLPADYWVAMAVYVLPDGGMVDAIYTNPRGFILAIEEGNLCKGTRLECQFGGQSLGRIWLGDMGADLYEMAQPGTVAPSSTAYAAFTYNGPGKIYVLIGMGMSKATFVKLAAAVVRVPKS